MHRFSTTALAPLCAPAALLVAFFTSPVVASIEPDVDPAESLSIDTTVEGVDIQVVDAVAQLQTPDSGEPYLRVDLTLENTGGEALHAVDWSLAADGIEVTLSPNALIKPGEQVTISELVLGSKAATLNGTSGVSIVIGSRAEGPLCSQMPPRSMCESFAASTQGLCWGSCIASGASGGSVTCVTSSYTDRNGVTCTQYIPQCVCTGRPTGTEALGSDLLDPFDPRVLDIVTNPPLIETRLHDIAP